MQKEKQKKKNEYRVEHNRNKELMHNSEFNEGKVYWIKN